MAKKLEDRLANAKEKVALLERKRREEAEIKRKKERQKNDRRKAIIGGFVVKHFPEMLRFEPGTNAENAVEFAQFDSFLSVLSTDVNLMETLKKIASQKLTSDD